MLSPHAFFVAFGLTLLPTLVTASPVVPHYFQRKLFSRGNISVTAVEAELGPQLSSGSLIFGPGNPQWSNATSRYDTFVRPDVQLVVEPATESDIAKIVSG